MTVIGMGGRADRPSEERFGNVRPRVGTQRSDRPTRGDEVRELCEEIGFPLLEWQQYALDVGLETAPDSVQWAFPDVAIAVSRQNGKTGGVLHPRILTGMVRWGERVIHSAQNRDLPRESFLEIAEVIETYFPELLAGKVRRANGQESFRLKNGASYKIVAPRSNAPRGLHADLVVLDEVREYRSFEFVSAVMPTLNTSRNPSVWWASNAGDPDSVVLNQLRERGMNGDPKLCWMEWSADPSLPADDPEAWAQANPAMGTLIARERIEHLYATMPETDFETEQLCRWVAISGSRAISEALWERSLSTTMTGAARPVISIDVDPDRTAAAIVAAWHEPDGRIGTDLVFYRSGDLSELAAGVQAVIDELKPTAIGYDPWTTESLAESLRSKGLPIQPITGRAWVSACQTLLELLQTDRLRHPGREVLSTQLGFAGRRDSTEGRWWIARGSEPIPAVTATARAVFLASRPRPTYSIH